MSLLIKSIIGKDRLRTNSKKEKISYPIVSVPDCISMHSEYNENLKELQDTLIKVFTYKNLPQIPHQAQGKAKQEKSPFIDSLVVDYHELKQKLRKKMKSKAHFVRFYKNVDLQNKADGSDHEQIDWKQQRDVDEKEEEEIIRQVQEIKRHCQEAEEAREACLHVIGEHLDDFIHKSSNAKYEDWLRSCHPENCRRSIDNRFYQKDSDHRMMWNTIQQRRRRLSLVAEPRLSQ